MMIREILVATDFSAASDPAARVAVALAGRFRARLHVLHVADPAEATTAFRQLDDLGVRLRPDASVAVVKVLETGKPGVEIVRYAARNRIDLIVVGTHGRSGLSRALRGSVAEAVVRTAACQVLTVKPAPSMQLAVTEAPEQRSPTVCYLCAQPVGQAICETCAKRVTAEARERKLRELRAGS